MVANYGVGIEQRLTGAHETAHYTQFSWGVSDRGCSIRIPWKVAVDGKGWLEDRRPNANIDPYLVSSVMVETICGAAAKGKKTGAKKTTAKKTAAKKRGATKKAAKKSPAKKTAARKPAKKAAKRR